MAVRSGAPCAVWLFTALALAGLIAPAVAQAATVERRNVGFTLINESNQNIDNLNISPVADDSWGLDLLGTLALPPHNRIIARPTQETGCVFDVRVVYHDLREEVLRKQNLCELDQITFTGRNAQAPSPAGKRT